jgi:hypothetical protein
LKVMPRRSLFEHLFIPNRSRIHYYRGYNNTEYGDE